MFAEHHPDPVGQAIHDVDAAVMRLVELATDHSNRKQMADDWQHIGLSLAALQIVCSVVEEV